LSVSQCFFLALNRAENAISAHSATGLIKSIILYTLVLGLEDLPIPLICHFKFRLL